MSASSAVGTVLLYHNEAVVALQSLCAEAGSMFAVASPLVQRIALVSAFVCPARAFSTADGAQWSFLPQGSSDAAAADPPSREALLGGHPDDGISAKRPLTADEITFESCDTPCVIMLRVEALGEDRQRTHAIGRKGATALALPPATRRLEITTSLVLPAAVVAAATSGAHHDATLRRVIGALIARLVVLRRVNAFDEGVDATPALLLRASRVCRYVGASLMRLETFAARSGSGGEDDTSILELHASTVADEGAARGEPAANRNVQTLKLRFADGGAAANGVTEAMARQIVVDASIHSMRAKSAFTHARKALFQHAKRVHRDAGLSRSMSTISRLGVDGAVRAHEVGGGGAGDGGATLKSARRAQAEKDLLAIAKASARLNAVLLSGTTLETVWDGLYASAPGAPMEAEAKAEAGEGAAHPTLQLSAATAWLRKDFAPIGMGDDGGAAIAWAYRFAVLSSVSIAAAEEEVETQRVPDGTIPMAAFPHFLHKAILFSRAAALIRYGEEEGQGEDADAEMAAVAEDSDPAALLGATRVDVQCFAQLVALAPHVNVGPEQADAAYALIARAQPRTRRGTVPFADWCEWLLRSEQRAAALRGQPNVEAGAFEAGVREEENENGTAAEEGAEVDDSEWLLPKLRLNDGSTPGELQWLVGRVTASLHSGEAAALSMFVRPCDSAASEREESATTSYRVHALVQLRHSLRKAQVREIAMEALSQWRSDESATREETYDESTSTRTTTVAREDSQSKWLSEVLTSVDNGSGRTSVTIRRTARNDRGLRQISNAAVVLPNSSDAIRDAVVTVDETTELELRSTFGQSELAAMLAGGDERLRAFAQRIILNIAIAPTPDDVRTFLDEFGILQNQEHAVRSVFAPRQLLSLTLAEETEESPPVAAAATAETGAAADANADTAAAPAAAGTKALRDADLLRAVRKADALRRRSELRKAMDRAVVTRRETLEREATQREKQELGRKLVEGLVTVRVHGGNARGEEKKLDGRNKTYTRKEAYARKDSFQGTKQQSYSRKDQKAAEKRRRERAISTKDLKRTQAALERYESNKARETSDLLDWEATVNMRSKKLNRALAKRTSKRQSEIREANAALRRNVGKVNATSGAHGRIRASTYGSRPTKAMRKALEVADGWKDKKLYQRQVEQARIDMDNRKLRNRLKALDPDGKLGLLEPQWKKQERRVRTNAMHQAKREHARQSEARRIAATLEVERRVVSTERTELAELRTSLRQMRTRARRELHQRKEAPLGSTMSGTSVLKVREDMALFRTRHRRHATRSARGVAASASTMSLQPSRSDVGLVNPEAWALGASGALPTTAGASGTLAALGLTALTSSSDAVLEMQFDRLREAVVAENARHRNVILSVLELRAQCDELKTKVAEQEAAVRRNAGVRRAAGAQTTVAAQLLNAESSERTGGRTLLRSDVLLRASSRRDESTLADVLSTRAETIALESELADLKQRRARSAAHHTKLAEDTLRQVALAEAHQATNEAEIARLQERLREIFTSTEEGGEFKLSDHPDILAKKQLIETMQEELAARGGAAPASTAVTLAMTRARVPPPAVTQSTSIATQCPDLSSVAIKVVDVQPYIRDVVPLKIYAAVAQPAPALLAPVAVVKASVAPAAVTPVAAAVTAAAPAAPAAPAAAPTAAAPTAAAAAVVPMAAAAAAAAAAAPAVAPIAVAPAAAAPAMISPAPLEAAPAVGETPAEVAVAATPVLAATAPAAAVTAPSVAAVAAAAPVATESQASLVASSAAAPLEDAPHAAPMQQPHFEVHEIPQQRQVPAEPSAQHGTVPEAASSVELTSAPAVSEEAAAAAAVPVPRPDPVKEVAAVAVPAPAATVQQAEPASETAVPVTESQPDAVVEVEQTVQAQLAHDEPVRAPVVESAAPEVGAEVQTAAAPAAEPAPKAAAEPEAAPVVQQIAAEPEPAPVQAAEAVPEAAPEAEGVLEPQLEEAPVQCTAAVEPVSEPTPTEVLAAEPAPQLKEPVLEATPEATPEPEQQTPAPAVVADDVAAAPAVEATPAVQQQQSSAPELAAAKESGAAVKAAPEPAAASAAEPAPVAASAAEPAPAAVTESVPAEPAATAAEPAPEPAPKFEDFPAVAHKPKPTPALVANDLAARPIIDLDPVEKPIEGSLPTAMRSPARKPHIPRQGGGHPSEVKPADPYHRNAYNSGEDGGMHDALVKSLGGDATK